jgi:hypothetical protein
MSLTFTQQPSFQRIAQQLSPLNPSQHSLWMTDRSLVVFTGILAMFRSGNFSWGYFPVEGLGTFEHCVNNCVEPKWETPGTVKAVMKSESGRWWIWGRKSRGYLTSMSRPLHYPCVPILAQGITTGTGGQHNAYTGIKYEQSSISNGCWSTHSICGPTTLDGTDKAVAHSKLRKAAFEWRYLESTAGEVIFALRQLVQVYTNTLDVSLASSKKLQPWCLALRCVTSFPLVEYLMQESYAVSFLETM